MDSRRVTTLGLATAVFAACVAAAVDDPEPEPQEVCRSTPGDEFPPTDCALVRGIARGLGGQVLAGLPIRVDSVVGENYYYASNATVSGSDGRFGLVVVRENRLKPPTDPDTATVELKAYATTPRPRDSAIARAAVLMYFAPLGQPVKPSVVEAVFDIAAAPTL
jgi:hypothetical protein